jgi:16S rRNA (uracil1498-N3)-methyltransferase
MARYDFRTPRLFVGAPLSPGARVPLDAAQSNYLLNVMRRKISDPVLVFNGRDGEWRARLEAAGRKAFCLAPEERTREQPRAGNLHYAFAPLKAARLDYMVQKAVEMGAALLQPVLTRHTQVERVNLERMRANAIEAAEQCGILAIPEIDRPASFTDFLGRLDADRLLVFCDEDAEVKEPVAALAALRREEGAALPLTVLVGPEGGFAEEERAALLRRPHVVRLSLGPRILRADTAAVAALGVIQAVLGDWR